MAPHIKLNRGEGIGAAVALAVLVSAGAVYAAPGYKVVHSFAGPNGHQHEGWDPFGGAPTLDSAGNVYVTNYGGDRNYFGALDKLAPNRTMTLLHIFRGGDGRSPIGGVLYDNSSGVIFGTATGGGSYDQGVLYELDPNGRYTVLHSFNGGDDGSSPRDAPARDSAGDLYGVTYSGGPSGAGTIWRLASKGTFTVLHAFSGADGSAPPARLIRGGETFYGTTSSGGANGYGTVFSITPGGAFTVLHSFDNVNDGGMPANFLARDRNGNLYGTASSGGANNFGTIFSLAPDGTFKVIYSFAGGADGGSPRSSLVLIDHKLYGTTISGGDSLCGTVFKASMSGTINTLHLFTNAPDGCAPYSGLELGPDRTLYGDTTGGGKRSYGALFRVSQ